MGEYDNVKYLEYIEKRNKMMNDFGRTGGRCDGANCSFCPLCDKSHIKCMDVYNPEEALRIVMEYKPSIDWSKVPVDTKICVRNVNKDGKGIWYKRYFAEYKNGKVYAWASGATSYSVSGECVTSWDEATLYEGDIISDKNISKPKYKLPKCFGYFYCTGNDDWENECDYCNHSKDCKKATEEKPNGK